MKVAAFLKLVELPTKSVSMFTLAIGTVYALYRFEDFSWINFALMFLSLLTFDMCTTAINNYIDFKKAIKRSGYGYEQHNGIVKYGLSVRYVLVTIFTLLTIASVSGFILFLRTSLLILALGGISFLVGILYSFGPLPISRMPLGEVFSGLFMGFVILYISAVIHTGDEVMALQFTEGLTVVLTLNLEEILYMFGASIASIAAIANIMLANNICDMEDDIVNKRYTLPVYVGKANSVKLFRYIYYASCLDIVIMLWLGVHPVLVVPVLLAYIPVLRNTRKFEEVQSKPLTFPLSVQNFMILSAARIIAWGGATLLSLIQA